MRARSGPFIRAVAAALVLPLAFPPLAWPAGATVAALRPVPMSPAGEGAWSGAIAEAARDPGIPFLGEEQAAERLRRWQEEEGLSRTAVREAAQAWGARARDLLARAWEGYYAFDFDRASSLVREAAALAPRFNDSRVAADFVFESFLLSAMAAKAAGREGGGEAFRRAAALRPEAELPDVRYSPAVREDFARARALLLAEGRAMLSVAAEPPGSEVLLDGSRIGTVPMEDVPILPGEHFVELRAPGRRSATCSISSEPWGKSRVDVVLPPAGPEGDPGEFFASRLLSGDTRMLAELAGRLDVDRFLIGKEEGGRLEVWLVDRSGRTASSVVLALGEGTPNLAAVRGMLLAQRGETAPDDPGIPLGYSVLPGEPAPPDPSARRPSRGRWAWLAAGVALLMALSPGGERETTNVEASW